MTTKRATTKTTETPAEGTKAPTKRRAVKRRVHRNWCDEHLWEGYAMSCAAGLITAFREESEYALPAESFAKAVSLYADGLLAEHKKRWGAK